MTKIIRRTYNPFNVFNPTSEMLSVRDLMNRMVENAYVNPSQWLSNTVGNAPALDVTESAENYTIKAELPGWQSDQVDITFENGVVTLNGSMETDKKEGEGENNEKYHYREIRKASFSRSISLPTEIEADKANAEFEHGVLTLTLPKAEVVKPKQIKIAVK